MGLVTEKQAEELWCPAARVVFVKRRRLWFWREITGYNRIANASRIGTGTAVQHSPSAHCIASKCMWWRWQLEPVNPDPMATVIGGQTPTKYERGFCGMAGKP